MKISNIIFPKEIKSRKNRDKRDFRIIRMTWIIIFKSKQMTMRQKLKNKVNGGSVL